MKQYAIPTVVYAAKNECLDIATQALSNIDFFSFAHIQGSELLNELKN